jgi:hypothetical protein
MTESKERFGVTGWLGWWDKLEQEFADLRANHTSGRHAANFVITGWHLTEWLWTTAFEGNEELQKRIFGKRFQNCKEFQFGVAEFSPAVGVLRGITNGLKHVKPEHDLTAHFQSEYGMGDFGQGPFGGGFVIVMPDGSHRSLVEIANEVMDYWKGVITSLK